MRKFLSAIFAAGLFLTVSCGSKVSLPLKTSLGDLTTVEKKNSVTTSKDPLSPKTGEVLYVLSFEGKKEYEVNGVAAPELMSMTGGLSDGSDIRFTDFLVSAGSGIGNVLNMPLIDASGKEYAPVLFGSPTAEGAISNTAVRFNGSVTGKDGKPWVKTGKFSFPEARIMVVYSVPADATLKLRDGSQQHAIN